MDNRRIVMNSVLDSIYAFENEIEFNHHSGRNADTTMIITCPDSRILLSAPHSVKQLRNGKRKVADINTFGIARLVQSNCNCNMITSLGNPHSDPNWDSTCFYKQQLDSVIRNSDVRVLLDIHGSANKDDYVDIDFGTAFGSTLRGCDDLMDVAYMLSLKHNLIVSENKYFTASNVDTIANYVSKTHYIPCIQIELSYDCRCTGKSTIAVQYLSELVSELQEYVSYKEFE